MAVTTTRGITADPLKRMKPALLYAAEVNSPYELSVHAIKRCALRQTDAGAGVRISGPDDVDVVCTRLRGSNLRTGLLWKRWLHSFIPCAPSALGTPAAASCLEVRKTLTAFSCFNVVPVEWKFEPGILS
jgi:hypothetical protein